MFRVSFPQVLLLAAALGGAALAQSSTPSSTRPGGTNQRLSVEGCQNEWLFDGVWRLRVLGVEKAADGWRVNFELRNGWREPQTPVDVGGTGGSDIHLITPSGETLNIKSIPGGVQYAKQVHGKKLAPGALLRHTLSFPAEGDALSQRPVKLLVGVKPLGASFRRLPYGQDPSFRVRLDCRR